MKKSFKLIGGVALAGVLTATAIFYSDVTEAKKNGDHRSNQGVAKNVILLVGDGMGQNQISAASYFKGEGYGANDLTMSEFKNIGFARTFSHDNVVTDSAAAATAFSASHKTDNGVLGKAPRQEEHSENEKHFNVGTVLEKAEKAGKATGLVSTARITHATPAAFASHIDDRNKENIIAKQMLLDHDIEVLLGGGKRHFLPKDQGGRREDGKNLMEAAEKKGYEVLGNKDDLEDADSGKLLGLFNDSHMTYELDRELTEEPNLAAMTEKALDVVEDDKEGFFLMVEGGRIDHAGHANYPAANIHDTLAFDDAVSVAKEFAKENKNTLVIVTADHETGGMSIGAKGTYGFNKGVLHDVKRTSEYIGNQLNYERTNSKDVITKYTGIKELTQEEIKTIKNAKSAGSGVADVISNRALIGWTTTGHTAVNVPVLAYGPQSSKLAGTIDNTVIADVIANAMKVKDNDDDEDDEFEKEDEEDE
ncbi:alkaline phosphatase [Lentibacillus juripiscarius]|uniref:Alkaline phosphatase n=1 Tax=Lentibacillus juripiscarius TaxID=257446 RepID=A0ABW5V8V9_9BACI